MKFMDSQPVICSDCGSKVNTHAAKKCYACNKEVCVGCASHYYSNPFECAMRGERCESYLSYTYLCERCESKLVNVSVIADKVRKEAEEKLARLEEDWLDCCKEH